VTFDANTDRLDAELKLRGRFNVENALGAAAAARALGIDEHAIRAGIEAVHGVPGRLEHVDEGQPFAVVVDYAHKPASLETVLQTMRELASGRVICVFGCGGDRDRSKRPLMGRIAQELADVAIVTSDNPRSEDPHSIIKEIVAGAPGLEVARGREPGDVMPPGPPPRPPTRGSGVSPSRYQGRPPAALVIREAAEAMAESWFSIDRSTVSSRTDSANVPSTTSSGDRGKKHSPSAYPLMLPLKRKPDRKSRVWASTTLSTRNRSISTSPNRNARTASSRRPVPATTP